MNFIIAEKASLLKIIGWNVPFLALNSVFPAVDIVLKMLVALATIIGIIHTMYIRHQEFKNKFKNNNNGERKSE